MPAYQHEYWRAQASRVGQLVYRHLSVPSQSGRRMILKGRQARLQFASTRRIQGSQLREEYNIDAIDVDAGV